MNAAAQILSDLIGFRLYGMAEDPTCRLPNGSSISPKLCRSRTSPPNLAVLAPIPASTPRTRWSTFRG